MSEPKSVPLYQHLTAAGVVRQQIAGVQARLKEGDDANAPKAMWFIQADTLGGVVPCAGDRCRGTDAVWRKLVSVGSLSDGAYPCVCVREGGP